MKKNTYQPSDQSPLVPLLPRYIHNAVSINEKASITNKGGKQNLRITRTFENLDQALSWLLSDPNPERFINLILRGSSSVSEKTSVSFDITGSVNMDLFADGRTTTSSPSESN